MLYLHASGAGIVSDRGGWFWQGTPSKRAWGLLCGGFGRGCRRWYAKCFGRANTHLCKLTNGICIKRMKKNHSHRSGWSNEFCWRRGEGMGSEIRWHTKQFFFDPVTVWAIWEIFFFRRIEHEFFFFRFALFCIFPWSRAIQNINRFFLYYLSKKNDKSHIKMYVLFKENIFGCFGQFSTSRRIK